jgi:hypothetical protein
VKQLTIEFLDPVDPEPVQLPTGSRVAEKEVYEIFSSGSPHGVFLPVTSANAFLRADLTGLQSTKQVGLSLSMAPAPRVPGAFPWPETLVNKLSELKSVENLSLTLYQAYPLSGM